MATMAWPLTGTQVLEFQAAVREQAGWAAATLWMTLLEPDRKLCWLVPGSCWGFVVLGVGEVPSPQLLWNKLVTSRCAKDLKYAALRQQHQDEIHKVDL